LLRYVFLPDGTNFNKYLIAEGYAHEYTYSAPYKYQTEFQKAETEARNGDKGLWSPTTCAGDTASTSPATGSAPAVSAPTAGTGDMDCKDFATQAQAQAYFNEHGGSATNNVDRLDGNDHDGIVCESLP
jgi:micrococcal nuclease